MIIVYEHNFRKKNKCHKYTNMTALDDSPSNIWLSSC